jgi:hypothetical protein
VADEQFARWWGERQGLSGGGGTQILNHPVVGALALDWDTLTVDTDPDQQLIVWTAAPGLDAHDRLRILASWAADQDLPASGSIG